MISCVDDYSCMIHSLGHILSESACERVHELGVLFLSKTEMERCVPLSGEDAHEMGVSFEMKRCVPLRGVKVPM
jgi:hypothetical protein